MARRMQLERGVSRNAGVPTFIAGLVVVGSVVLTGCQQTDSKPTAGATTPSAVASTSLGAVADGGCPHADRPRHPAGTVRGGVATHISSLLGYQIQVPQVDRLIAACTSWTAGQSGDEAGDGTTDVFLLPHRARFIVSSQVLPTGMTGHQWLLAYADHGGTNPNCWPPAESWPTMRIAGRTAYLHGESLYCNFTEAVAVADGRGFVFTGRPQTTCCGVFDMGVFRDLLAHVRFINEASSS
jgi:hypothetical protein